MSEFKIGQLYDPAFAKLTPLEVQQNLDGIAWGIEERAYTKNLTPEEIVEKKDEYSEVGLVLSEINREKKEAMDAFKARAKQPTEDAKILLDAIKFKSEQKHGKLHLVDDQDKGMMYFFDTKGVCVDARPLAKNEKQMRLKTVNSNQE